MLYNRAKDSVACLGVWDSASKNRAEGGRASAVRRRAMKRQIMLTFGRR